MAKEFIEREDAIAAVHEEWDEVCNFDGSGSTIAYDTERAIDRVPAADVAPVVRGRWIESYSGWTPTKKCSACDVHFTQFPMKAVVKGEPIKPVLNFCPNCGADMREVQQ